MSVRREKRSRKFRGTRSVGWGRIGQHRKAGSKGGTGMSGYHKHKWSWTVKYGQDIFGKNGFSRPWARRKEDSLNLDQLVEIAIAKGTWSLDLSELGYSKLLGRGRVSQPIHVKVDSASATAREKIKSAGGEIELISRS